MNNQISKNCTVYCDRDRIKQILTNLINNSVKYTNEPGEIILTISNTLNKITFTIEDSKPGVRKYELEKIFERLYRCEQSRSRETGGSGLGLAICKSLIEAHGGNIKADLSLLGGLKVIIEIPMSNIVN